MPFLLANLVTLAAATAISWWLSGYDSRLTGNNTREDLIRRIVRCGITLLIVEVAFIELRRCWMDGDRAAGLTYLAMLVPLALFWTGCISEAGAQCFHHLIDPQDKRPYDPKYATRELDAVGDLIRSGRKEEAIQLCRMLLQASDGNRAALELTLHHLGAPLPERAKEAKPLAEAGRLRQAGKFNEAETILTSLLKNEPSNVDAALMLIRLYAQDLRQIDKAAETLRSLESQRHVSAAHLEFARRSLMDSQTQSTFPEKESPEEPAPASIEELIDRKYFGTAVEVLERQCEAEPDNFDVWIKLAEVHGMHCANIPLAEKTIRQIDANPHFSAEQKDQARRLLRQWRERKECTG